MTKGWKVTKIINGVNYSAIMALHILRYDIDIPTSRPEDGGPLTLFATKEEATAFLNPSLNKTHPDNSPYAIHPCDYTPSTDTQLWHKSHTPYMLPLPPGTLLADDITLRKK